MGNLGDWIGVFLIIAVLFGGGGFFGWGNRGESVQDASTTTGLSQWYLREGCKAGSVPHIRSGGKIYINVPALLAKLDRESSQTEERQ